MGKAITDSKIFLDNILFYLQRSGGGSVYWGELSKRAKDIQSFSFIAPTGVPDNKVYEELSLKDEIKESIIPLSILRYMPLTKRLPAPAIFHSSYYRFSLQKHIRNYVTIHDFTYEYFRKGVPMHIHKMQKGLAIKHSSHIICISNATKSDLLKFYPGVDKEKKIRVIHNGVSKEYFPLSDSERYPQSEECESREIIFIGHRTEYKNFEFAVDVVSALPSNYKLSIVGDELSVNEKLLLKRKLNTRFNFWGYLDNAMLNKLYNRSHCLLYPSSYEGFGIPILEAFRAKCPVVAKNIPAVAEIAGNGAFLADYLDISGFVKNIRALESFDVRMEKMECGYYLSRIYSWDKCFSELMDFYNA